MDARYIKYKVHKIHQRCKSYVPLVEFTYLVFSHMPRRSYQRWLRSLCSWLYVQYLSSIMNSLCRSIPFQIALHASSTVVDSARSKFYLPGLFHSILKKILFPLSLQWCMWTHKFRSLLLRIQCYQRLQAWSKSEHNFACFICCQEFNILYSSQFIYFVFLKNPKTKPSVHLLHASLERLTQFSVWALRIKLVILLVD